MGEGEKKIVVGVALVVEVAARLEGAPAAPGEQVVHVVVGVGVADRQLVAPEDDGVVEERAGALLDRLHLRDQIGHLLRVEAVDLDQLRLGGGVVGRVVGEFVVALGVAELAEGGVADALRPLEAADAGDVAGHRRDHQVDLEPPDGLVVLLGVDVADVADVAERGREHAVAAELAHRVEVAVDAVERREVLFELGAVAAPELALELLGVAHHRVEDEVTLGREPLGARGIGVEIPEDAGVR